jgi:DNA polymerase-3 subunit epsilon
MDFLAIDFETADYGSDSACAVGLVRVCDGEIVRRDAFLIRPPRRNMVFTHIHGITWADVADKPTFGEHWHRIEQQMAGIDFLVAHNAGFDRGVLNACCRTYGLPVPPHPFQCTMQLARKLWNIRPTKLPNVCRHFGIPLNHHDAGSDTEACARIMIEALKEMKPPAPAPSPRVFLSEVGEPPRPKRLVLRPLRPRT